MLAILQYIHAGLIVGILLPLHGYLLWRLCYEEWRQAQPVKTFPHLP